jgi:hypothetical protein
VCCFGNGRRTASCQRALLAFVFWGVACGAYRERSGLTASSLEASKRSSSICWGLGVVGSGDVREEGVRALLKGEVNGLSLPVGGGRWRPRARAGKACRSGSCTGGERRRVGNRDGDRLWGLRSDRRPSLCARRSAARARRRLTTRRLLALALFLLFLFSRTQLCYALRFLPPLLPPPPPPPAADPSVLRRGLLGVWTAVAPRRRGDDAAAAPAASSASSSSSSNRNPRALSFRRARAMSLRKAASASGHVRNVKIPCTRRHSSTRPNATTAASGAHATATRAGDGDGGARASAASQTESATAPHAAILCILLRRRGGTACVCCCLLPF